MRTGCRRHLPTAPNNVNEKYLRGRTCSLRWSGCDHDRFYIVQELKVVSSFLEETQVELGVVPAAEGGAVRDEDVAAHRGDGRVVADDVAQVPRLNTKEGEFSSLRQFRKRKMNYAGFMQT